MGRAAGRATGVSLPCSKAAEGRLSRGKGVTLRQRPVYLVKQGEQVAQPVGDLDAQELGELREAEPPALPRPGARRVALQLLLQLLRFQAEEKKKKRRFPRNYRMPETRDLLLCGDPTKY